MLFHIHFMYELLVFQSTAIPWCKSAKDFQLCQNMSCHGTISLSLWIYTHLSCQSKPGQATILPVSDAVIHSINVSSDNTFLSKVLNSFQVWSIQMLVVNLLYLDIKHTAIHLLSNPSSRTKTTASLYLFSVTVPMEAKPMPDAYWKKCRVFLELVHIHSVESNSCKLLRKAVLEHLPVKGALYIVNAFWHSPSVQVFKE